MQNIKSADKDVKQPSMDKIFVPVSDHSLEHFQSQAYALAGLVPFNLDYQRPRIVAEESGWVYHFEPA